jgi:hypothetical protein
MNLSWGLGWTCGLPTEEVWEREDHHSAFWLAQGATTWQGVGTPRELYLKVRCDLEPLLWAQGTEWDRSVRGSHS